MEAKELMIGDWVLLPECFNKRETKVTDVGICVEVENSAGVYGAEELSPIPLTPEILENNGFKPLEEDSYVCSTLNESEDHRIVIDLLVPYLSYIEKDKMPKARYSGEIKFIHQLQNALRLCGILKEIKL